MQCIVLPVYFMINLIHFFNGIVAVHKFQQTRKHHFAHSTMMYAHTGEQNERNLLHYVKSILPCLIGKYEHKFETDQIVSSLKDH